MKRAMTGLMMAAHTAMVPAMAYAGDPEKFRIEPGSPGTCEFLKEQGAKYLTEERIDGVEIALNMLRLFKCGDDYRWLEERLHEYRQEQRKKRSPEEDNGRIEPVRMD